MLFSSTNESGKELGIPPKTEIVESEAQNLDLLKCDTAIRQGTHVRDLAKVWNPKKSVDELTHGTYWISSVSAYLDWQRSNHD